MNQLQNSKQSSPVKLGLPSLVAYSDRIHVHSLLLRNTDSAFPPVVVEYVEFTDARGHKARSQSFCIPPQGGTHSISCDISVENPPLLSRGHIEISIFTGTGIKYSVLFACDSGRTPKCSFVKSTTTTMTEQEQLLSSQLFQKWIQPPPDRPPDQSGKKPPSNKPDPALEGIRKAVFTEMYYLKSNGGRQYKVSSGKYLCRMNGLYAYQFEMETEVYLADDSPVKVSCAAAMTEGTVLLCDGFEILLLLPSDLGPSISSGTISVEPWKLLEALNKRIENESSLGSIAKQFLYEGPSLATKLPAIHIPKGQEAAKEHALCAPITIIWGPPGTGKTHTMSEIAISLLRQGKTVLLVSHSNVSVDGVAAKIASLLRSQGLGMHLKRGDVLRYGYIRDEKLSQDPYASAYNYALSNSITFQKQLEDLQRKKDTEKAKSRKLSQEAIKIESEIKAIRRKIHMEERKYVETARIVATTVSKIYADSLFENKKYDVVMFDEVSMAYVAQLLCAATFAKERFICVGDFRQLSPIAQSKAKDTLSQDVFSHLGISDGCGHIYAHPWLVMLDEQRRMHPGISEFVSKEVYASLLKDHESVFVSRTAIIERAPFEGHSMNLIDLKGTYCAAGKNSDNSRFNILSAVLAFGSALSAETAGEESVGIITPYAAQTRLVRAMIQDYRKTGKTQTTCATVHQFQGSERNVVIFDAVESYPSTKTGWLMSKNENGSVTRLINVAVTRARGKLITIANCGYWESKFKGSDHAFYKLIQHILRKGNVIGVKEQHLQNYCKAFRLGENISIFTTREDAFELFTKDIGKAKKALLVSLPGSSQFGTSENQILDLFKKTANNGAHLMIKAKEYSRLPEEWKKYTWSCDNAIFPTVLIDDMTLWYGFPQEGGIFKDGNTGFSTVFPLWIRFTGEQTIEQIKSLAALNMRYQGHIGIPMSEKKQVSQKGIAAYISKTEKCSNCGHPMALGKSRTGKVNLLCTHCNNTQLLTPASVNHYIRTNGVRCPTCGEEIICGVSYKGLHVKCPQGHWAKIEEL